MARKEEVTIRKGFLLQGNVSSKYHKKAWHILDKLKVDPRDREIKKPKAMHWKTYWRLVEEYKVLERLFFELNHKTVDSC